ncbi:hypothetical protein CI102_5402 [Trichoderma harzianum]|nr:hypothetical protein CI102_5402 [Trichoderma harzianum]
MYKYSCSVACTLVSRLLCNSTGTATPSVILTCAEARALTQSSSRCVPGRGSTDCMYEYVRSSRSRSSASSCSTETRGATFGSGFFLTCLSIADEKSPVRPQSSPRNGTTRGGDATHAG